MAIRRRSTYAVYSEEQKEQGKREDVRIAVPAKAHERNAPMTDVIARPIKPKNRDNTASEGDV